MNGGEIVNDARTLAYLDAGYGPNGMMISGGCSCPRIRELIECGGAPYVSPKDDPAPWYDASIPESADFAGFLMTEFSGMESTYVRTPIDKISGGSVLGRLQAKGRVLSWKGFLFGRSECSVRFGMSWLTSNLKSQDCICGGEDLDLLICCPELTESPPVSGCNSVPIAKPEVCPPFSQPDAFRTLKNVGLIEGPKILSERKTGCTSNCSNSSCLGGDGSLILEVEFHLLAGNPYFYGCPVCLCVDQVFPSVGDCATTVNWTKVLDTTVTLRPNFTVSTVGVVSVTGASLGEAALSDNSDSSFITLQTSQVTYDFGTSTIPTTAIIKSVTPRIRYSGDALQAVQLKNSSGTGKTVNTAPVQGSPFNYSGVSETTNFTLSTWSQSDIDSIRLYLSNTSGTPTLIYEAYIDVVYVDNVCNVSCPDAYDCSADVVSICPPVSLPTIPTFVDSCFCEPFLPVQNCCTIPASAFSTFFEGAPIIEIYSGSSVMRSTIIRFFDNPQNLACCETATDPCRDCDSLQIRYIPKESTLTVDGTTRTVTLQCGAAGVTTISADHLLVSPFSWPMLECMDFCICTETDAMAVAADATVSISVVPRTMS